MYILHMSIDNYLPFGVDNYSWVLPAQFLSKVEQSISNLWDEINSAHLYPTTIQLVRI